MFHLKNLDKLRLLYSLLVLGLKQQIEAKEVLAKKLTVKVIPFNQ